MSSVLLTASLSAVCVILIFICLTLASKYAILLISNKRMQKYLYNYLNILTGARYGDLNRRCEDGIDALTILLAKNTNALLESIFDRDIMISEYIEREKQTVNLKQDFISSLTHDLKVPIIAQNNTYDLLLAERFGKLSQEQIAAIKNLKISNNDLKNLILNLLDAQKLDRQELELNKENTNLVALINELLEQDKSIILYQNKNVTFSHAQSELWLSVDPFLIKRALNNLISNAIFYSKNAKNIEIILNKTPAAVEISVKDEGVGIDEQDISNIFKKYYSSAKKYADVGSGLGLYIVNKIASAHKGTVSAKNNPEKGACFTITIPCE